MRGLEGGRGVMYRFNPVVSGVVLLTGSFVLFLIAAFFQDASDKAIFLTAALLSGMFALAFVLGGEKVE